jgi:succinate dehydrogenase / fumarate reductase iron-sulfur subunit
VLKDLVVDRSAFDRIIQQGGYISVNTGAAPEAHSVQVPKEAADRAFDMATCIGCGACVAACPNGSATLFMGAKVTHLGELPQGQAERDARVVHMVAQHDAEGFGGCTNIGECSAACPKEIPLDVIAQLNKDLLHALRTGH